MGEGVVTRIAGRKVPPYEVRLVFALLIGPAGSGYSEEELELAWHAYSGDKFKPKPGWRCWGWWKFEAHEDPPDDQPARLAELGLGREDELAAG